ncbi:hypothetical protein ACA910_000264 [Epithemia clementina (nom. ined.)]
MALPIRTVAGHFPSSADLWDETSLPLAITLQPLAGSHSFSSSSSSSTNDGASTFEKVSLTGGGGASLTPPPPLSSIPKCLKCGAPHPSRQTHYHPSGSSSSGVRNHYSNGNNNETFVKPTFLLCYLCGKVSSTTTEQQYAARSQQEEDVGDVSFSIGRGAKSASNDTCVFALPLRIVLASSTTTTTTSGGSQQPASSTPPVYKVPAMSCPILWFVVLDATATESTYWRTVHQLLMDRLDSHKNNNNDDDDDDDGSSIPPYVHLSILLVSQQDCRIFQLDSPVPHLQQYPLQQLQQPQNSSSSSSAVLMERIFESLVPMDEVHKAHTKTMLRSLMDYASYQPPPPTSYPNTVNVVTAYEDDDTPLNSLGAAAASDYSSSSYSPSGMPLSWILSALSESLLQFGHKAGERYFPPPSSSSTITTTSFSSQAATRFPYAGAQVSILLGNPPMHQTARVDGTPLFPEPISSSKPTSSKLNSTRGVLGGRALPGEFQSQSSRFGLSIENSGENGHGFDTDWSPEALEDRYPDGASIEWMNYYADLGRQCVDAGLGIDILGIATAEEGLNTHSDFGLVLLSGLVKTGGHGTAVYPIPSAREALQSEWTSRAPWKNGRAFAAELRLRLSPGFHVDVSSTAHPDEEEIPLVELYNEAGLTGPAFAVDEPCLWRTSSCDQYTTFSVDLRVAQPIVPKEFYVEHLGNVVTKPVVQTCFAYNTIETLNDGQAYTVRRMRISCRPVGKPLLANDTEAIYNSLDPEAMAVVLFHKLTLASLRDGIEEAKPIAEEWLQALLVCAYRSAQRKDQELQEEQRNGLLPSVRDTLDENNLFIASERLLNRDGELSESDVLLAKGHPHLQNMPLMIYMLLQSDAFANLLSLDDRFAALSQLSSMPPDTLTRCIAPRLQLWAAVSPGENGNTINDSNNNNNNNQNDNTIETEPLVELIELRQDAIHWAVQDCAQSMNEGEGFFFFVDSPREILVVDASLIVSSVPKSTQAHVSVGLQNAIDFARSSYSTRPLVRYVLEEYDTEGLQAFRELCCNEDKPLFMGGGGSVSAALTTTNSPSSSSSSYANFEAWRQAMAAQVESQLDDDMMMMGAATEDVARKNRTSV